MNVEIIYGQIVAKANHYLSVSGRDGERRIIKDEAIRAYERSFLEQCKVYRGRHIRGLFRLFVKVYHRSHRFDLDNSIKTLLDCLQDAGAIENDNNCYSITAEKHIDPYRPRIEFAIEEIHGQGTLFS